MFSPLMINTWVAASILAVAAGVVGFFTVIRGSAFVAHAVPQSAFAGAAAASLLGLNTILGLGVFALLGALGIGALGRRGRHDVATALSVVLLLGLGSLFLSFTTEYSSEIYSLLFGEILGVSRGDLLPIAGLGLAAVVAVLALFRPLLLSSLVPDVGEARGIGAYRMEICFLIIVALVTSMAVPVVGALLIFSLLIGPPAAARSVTDRPGIAMALSVAIAMATVWVSIVVSYVTNLPIGFFVGSFAAAFYAAGRGWAAWTRSRPSPAAHLADTETSGLRSS
jgi:zinc/manganese transport system permease protein